MKAGARSKIKSPTGSNAFRTLPVGGAIQECPVGRKLEEFLVCVYSLYCECGVVASYLVKEGAVLPWHQTGSHRGWEIPQWGYDIENDPCKRHSIFTDKKYIITIDTRIPATCPECKEIKDDAPNWLAQES